ncbi:uncharacterized protein LOC109544221 [Dendroctonus ponderosae]|uniref:uncharacterized protein LOC109544221 n=1 Tax=Dendroctonus ponderosae TaxID=77166 RepID=UPI0020366325|nr:uncharacterized protein LOC109544221 [Dendroctonus ponderosae]
MGRKDPGPQKYKESNKIDTSFCFKVLHQDKYWTDLILRPHRNEIIAGYNTTPGEKFAIRYPPYNWQRFTRSRSENDCSIPQYEYYLKHNLYIKSAVETQNLLGLQTKNVTFRNYTPKSLSQEVNMGMWI